MAFDAVTSERSFRDHALADGAHAGNQLFDLRQDTRHDHVDAGGGRVQAIGLVELGIAGHPVEEERIKDDRMSSRQAPDKIASKART